MVGNVYALILTANQKEFPMKAFERALEITANEIPGNWCWWFLPTDDPIRFQLIVIYSGNDDFIHHGLFFSALDRTEATRKCHKLNYELFSTSKSNTIAIVETVTEKLRYIDDVKRHRG